MNLQLPNSVYSPQDVTSLALEVRNYAKWFSQTSIQQKVTSGPVTEPPLMSLAAAELLRQLNEPLNQQSLGELIAALEEFKATAASITITLAAPAPGDLKQKLVSWCRQNISPGILVTFKFNATILGGMVVSYGSSIFDWSFRRQILANRHEFPEVLRRV